MSITAYPLAWPTGWKRTAGAYRTYGRFGTAKSNGSWTSRADISVAVATQRLRDELRRMGVNDDDMVLSTNLKLRLDGLPRSDQGNPADPGAAVYWNDPASNVPRCMAIDVYTKVEQNIAALAATIEAMRAIERHGGALVLERAFTGFTALPAPTGKRTWQEVMGLPPHVTLDEMNARYRRLASERHPDRGGSMEAMAELNQAREAALEALR